MYNRIILKVWGKGGAMFWRRWRRIRWLVRQIKRLQNEVNFREEENALLKELKKLEEKKAKLQEEKDNL